jgi:hypothetical protein
MVVETAQQSGVRGLPFNFIDSFFIKGKLRDQRKFDEGIKLFSPIININGIIFNYDIYANVVIEIFEAMTYQIVTWLAKFQ